MYTCNECVAYINYGVTVNMVKLMDGVDQVFCILTDFPTPFSIN